MRFIEWFKSVNHYEKVDFDSVGLEWGQRSGIANQLSGDVFVASPQTTLKVVARGCRPELFPWNHA